MIRVEFKLTVTLNFEREREREWCVCDSDSISDGLWLGWLQKLNNSVVKYIKLHIMTLHSN